jgi:lysophospholipase L1-like esterase
LSQKLTMKNYFLALALLMTFVSKAQITNQNLYDTVPNLIDHYLQRVEQFKKEPVITGKIIFLGNSITEGGNWAELTGDKTVINRGIGGDVTFGVLQRLEEITQRKPSKLFILIGINDIGNDIPDLKIADNYRKIIEYCQAKTPETIIYIQSVLPVNPTYPKFPQHYDKESHVIHTNELLKQLSEKYECKFINLFPVMMDGQQRLNKNYTTDGLHLNAKGYTTWIDYLRKNGYL